MLILPCLLSFLASFPATQDSSGSLESFLASTRARHAAQLEALTPTLRPLLRQLGAESGSVTEKHRLREEILTLGPAIAPLLVPELEVDEKEAETSLRRALEVTRVLVKMQPGGVNRPLLDMAQNGSMGARARAIEVLGHVSNPLGINAYLTGIYVGIDPELKAACITAIASRGAAENLDILRGALQDIDPKIRRIVLLSLTESRDASAASSVLAAITKPGGARSMGPEVVAYYQSVPDVVDEEVVELLASMAVEASNEREQCLPILGALPGFQAARKSRDLRRILEPLRESFAVDIREGALVCLHLTGDRSAKKELLKFYNEKVKDDPRFFQSYTKRGEIYLRIGEYSDAAKDFSEGIDLMTNDRSPAYRKAMIDLARAFALGSKLSRAKDTLLELGLTQSERSELSRDPDFAEFLANPRYGKLLE